MSKLTTLLLIGAGYLGYRYWQAKKAIDGLQIKVTGVAVAKTATDLLNTGLHLTVSVLNPSGTQLSFQRFAGVVLYQGHEFARFDAHEPTVIVPNGITQVPVDTMIENINALPVLSAALQTGIENVPLQIQGTLTISALQVPVNMTIND